MARRDSDLLLLGAALSARHPSRTTMKRASDHRRSIKKSHQCDECFRYFACPHNVEQHKREKHTLERPYVCRACGKGFARPFTCNRHVRSLHKRDPETMVIDLTAKGKKGRTHRPGEVVSAPVEMSQDWAPPPPYIFDPPNPPSSDNYTYATSFDQASVYGNGGGESQNIANYDLDTTQVTSWIPQPPVGEYWQDDTIKTAPAPNQQPLPYDFQPRSVPEVSYPSQQAHPLAPYYAPGTMPPSQPPQTMMQAQYQQPRQPYQHSHRQPAAVTFPADGATFDWCNPTSGGSIDFGATTSVAGDVHQNLSFPNLYQPGPVLAKHESAGPMAVTNDLISYNMWN